MMSLRTLLMISTMIAIARPAVAVDKWPNDFPRVGDSNVIQQEWIRQSMAGLSDDINPATLRLVSYKHKDSSDIHNVFFESCGMCRLLSHDEGYIFRYRPLQAIEQCKTNRNAGSVSNDIPVVRKQLSRLLTEHEPTVDDIKVNKDLETHTIWGPQDYLIAAYKLMATE